MLLPVTNAGKQAAWRVFFHRRITMNNLVNYSVYDDNGDVYCKMMPASEAALCDLHTNKRFRLLNALKAAAEAAGPSIDNSASAVLLMPIGDPTPPNAPQPAGAGNTRATGKNGAKWIGNSVTVLLNCSLPYRRWLRGNPVSQIIWQNIPDAMYFGEDKLDYSWEQIREKMRNLKNKFNKSNEKWEHYWLMVYLFTEVIKPGDVTLSQPGYQQHLDDPLQEMILEQNDAPVVNDLKVIVVPSADDLDTPDVRLPENLVGSADDLDTPDVRLPENLVGSADDLDTPDVRLPETLVGSADDLVLPDEAEGLVPIFSSTVLSSSLMELQIDTRANRTMSTPEVCRTPRKSKVPAAVTSALLRSPAPKKCKAAAGLSAPRVQRSPATPKRKTPKVHLQWEPEEAESLLKICIEKKNVMQDEKIPLDAWKEICHKLDQTAGIKKSWQTCRDKFNQMKSFFGTMLLSKGKLGVSKWCHYDKMCEIFEIPQDYIDVLNASDDGNNAVVTNEEEERKLWPRERVLLLISLFKAKKDKFNSTKSTYRHDVLWAKISSQIKEFGHIISWKQCGDKMSRLKSKLDTEFRKGNGTGASPSTWEFYTEMLDILGGTATLNAPYLLSAGMTNSFRVKGEVQGSRKSETRTRPTAASSKSLLNESKGKPKKPIYKNWMQEMQEKQFAQREKLLQEVTLLREGVEENRNFRKQMYYECFKKTASRSDPREHDSE